MIKPRLIAAALIGLALTCCNSKSDVSAGGAGRFSIVSIGPEEAKISALLDSETGCIWEYRGPGTNEYYGADFEGVLTVGYYPDIFMQSRTKLPIEGDAKASAELKSEEGKNQIEQASDCDAIRYQAVRNVLGRKGSR